MKLFQPCCRLTFRTWPEWVADHLLDVRLGVRNIIRWIPVIWFDKDFDSDYLLRVMEFKLQLMAKCFRKHGHHISSDRDARRCAVAAALCHRLIEDNYFEEARRRFGEDIGRAAAYSNAVQTSDLRYLGILLGKYTLGWWD